MLASWQHLIPFRTQQLSSSRAHGSKLRKLVRVGHRESFAFFLIKYQSAVFCFIKIAIFLSLFYTIFVFY